MPPARASATARRASVTVSIAAERTGIASEIPRVRRVTVETSLGRTCDSAGTSRTSSKVSPSRANFSSSATRRSSSSLATCTSARERSYQRRPTRSVASQPVHFICVDRPAEPLQLELADRRRVHRLLDGREAAKIAEEAGDVGTVSGQQLLALGGRDELGHLGRQEAGQLCALPLDCVDQPGVRNRDGSLVREGLDELDLVVCERPW